MSAGFLQMGQVIEKIPVLENCQMSARCAMSSAIGQRTSPLTEAEFWIAREKCALYSDPHLYPLPFWERRQTLHGALALDEDAALGPDAHTVHVGARKLRRADRLIDGRALVEVRLERLALVECEIYLDGICRGRLRVLRRASAEREHSCQSGG